jgi:hypothetical protein
MTERIRSARGEAARRARDVLLALALLLLTAGCAGLGGPADSRSVGFPAAFDALGPGGPGGDARGLDLADDPRFVVRDRLDLAGPSRSDALAGTSFSHRSRRYHVYPFTTYGSSRVQIRVTPQDPAMAERSAVWILGPRQSDGRFASVRGAAGPSATVEIEASGLAEYVAIVGPAEPGAFLPRYPGVEALLEMDTEDGFEEGTARFDLEARAVGVADSDTDTTAIATSDMILSFAGDFDPEFDALAGRRFRVESPVTEVARVDALPEDPFGLVFASECADAACAETQGELLAFAPRAWTRYQLYAPETAASLDDARLAAMNDPQEGFFTVFSATSPHRAEESYLVLEAIGADGQPESCASSRWSMATASSTSSKRPSAAIPGARVACRSAWAGPALPPTRCRSPPSARRPSTSTKPRSTTSKRAAKATARRPPRRRAIRSTWPTASTRRRKSGTT